MAGVRDDLTRYQVTRPDGSRVRFRAPERRAAIRYARVAFGYNVAKTLRADHEWRPTDET